MRGSWPWLVGAVMLLLAAYDVVVNGGPILGDPPPPSHEVHIVNATSATVLVHEGMRTDRAYDVRLEPRQVRQNRWVVPTTDAARAQRRRMVRAWEEGGSLVFCREYTYDDMERLGWRVEIAAGVVECG